MKKIILLFFFGFFCNYLFSQTNQQLLDAAIQFPAMPKSTTDLSRLLGKFSTFASGTPFNDLEFTIYDTDYMDGENSGGDTFMPVDPSDNFPGANKIKLIRCVLNTDLNENYGSGNVDRIILGTNEISKPFFLKGEDGIDNDYLVILHFDYENGLIQLKGQAQDYKLEYFTIANGVKTEGWYLFYVANNSLDLISFIFPCSVIEPAISGNPPNNANPLCNTNSLLALDNTTQFKFATAINTNIVNTKGIAQFGSNGKEIIGGITVDSQQNSYLFGMTDGNLDGRTDSENEIFISKISPSGVTLWVTELPMKEGTLL